MKKTIHILLSLVMILVVALCVLTACNTTIQRVDFKVTFDVDGESYYVIATQGTEVLKMPNDPTKEGYVFDGWFWDKDKWQRPFTANSLLNEPLKEDMRVYAKWTDENELEKFTVTFETNGGTTLQSMYCAVVKAQPVTNKDYNTFLGWYTDANFNESAKVTFPFAVTEDITLYAKWSVDFTDGIQFSLQTSSNSYFVSGYTGVETTLVIPETYNGVPVTGIVARAFEGNSMLVDVMIPDSVSTVGLGAFSECYALKKVKMSSNLQLLGSSAFSNCINLEEIDLPATLQNIGGEAFFGCAKLKELYLANELVNIGTNIIRGCNSLEKLTMPGRITLISLVGDTVDNIPQSLSEIRIADGSTNIVDSAFKDCKMIKSIWICKSVEAIAQNAFEDAINILDITIEEQSQIKSFEKGVFQSCEKLQKIVIPFVGASIDGDENTHFGYIFGANNFNANSTYVPETLTDVIITDGTKIADNAFYGCISIENLEIPESVTEIGYGIIQNCNNIVNISIDENNEVYKSIDNCIIKIDGGVLLAGCQTSVIPTNKSVKTIASYSFSGQNRLSEITIPNSITNIGNNAFSGCSSLNSIIIPDSVESIGVSAFSGCSGLTEMTIPFVGATKDDTSNTHFGYIFGASSGRGTWSYNSYVGGNQSYVPSSLQEVIIKGGTSIDDYAFYDCSNITNVIIPNSVTNVGSSVFYGCNALTSIMVDDNNPNYVCQDGILYDKGKTEIVHVPKAIKGAVTILDDVTEIRWNAFNDCSGLTSITIPDSVTSIGSGAFSGCINLQDATLSTYALSHIPTAKLQTVYITSGDNIEVGVFKNSNELVSINMPHFYTFNYQYTYEPRPGLGTETSSVSLNCLGAMFGCTTTNVGDETFPTGEKILSYYYYDNGSGKYCYGYLTLYFYKPKQLRELVIRDQQSRIPPDAYRGLNTLSSISISSNVTSVGDDAFEGCDNLQYSIYDNASYLGNNNNPYFILIKANSTSITSCALHSNTKIIHSNAFASCSSLNSITIPDSVTSIGGDAFSGCSSLNSITIPDSVTSIGYKAFSGCSRLIEMTIPFVGRSKSATEASWSTQFGYIFGTSSYTGGTATEQYYGSTASTTSTTYYIPTSLKKVTVTGGNILYGTFYNCHNLTSVTLPNSVKSIDDYAFYSCYNLTSITIPDSVTSIGSDAFYNCHNLTSITIPDSVTSIGSDAFDSCYGLTSITIPDRVTSIGDGAFAGCSSLNSITIPDSVTSIGEYAFSYCNGLTSVTFKGMKAQWNKISKGSNWNYPTGNFIVHCADGDLNKYGSEI